MDNKIWRFFYFLPKPILPYNMYFVYCGSNYIFLILKIVSDSKRKIKYGVLTTGLNINLNVVHF